MTTIDRREAIRRLALFSAAAVLPVGALACSRKASCLDVTGLSPDEVNQRTSVAAYAESSADPNKKCARCTHFVAAAPNTCGACKIVKGPINAAGGCKLFVDKPA